MKLLHFTAVQAAYEVVGLLMTVCLYFTAVQAAYENTAHKRCA